MTMLREFFDCTKDSHLLFDDLLVARTDSYQYLNQYPTLYFSFKDCKADASGVSGLIKLIYEEILKQYQVYKFLREQLDEDDLYTFDDNYSILLKKEADKWADVRTAISFLANTLYKCYKKPVMLIIDEYDTPLESAYVGGFYDEVHGFISTLYSSALKGGTFLEKGILTGIQRIAKENIFSGLNNLEVYTVLDSLYSCYFGLTEDETRYLLNGQRIELTDEVKGMYNGYNFGGTYIYNPWSVINYAKRKCLVDFWISTASNKMIRELLIKYREYPDFAEGFEVLLTKGTANVMMDVNTSYSEEQKISTLWALLLNAGYITISDTSFHNTRMNIKIPNIEVWNAFKVIIGDYTALGENSLDNLFYYLVQAKDINAFKKEYQQLVYTSTSFYDAKENAYHMLFLGMCMYLKGYYKVTSNIEAGDGRADLILESLSSGHPHIIIEFKQGDELETLATAAINQIEDRQYAINLHGDTVLLGIAHNKKKCEIKSKEITL